MAYRAPTADAYEWFTFVPEWNGNREETPEERISCEMKRLNELETLAWIGWTEDDMERWRDTALKDRLFDKAGKPSETDEAKLLRQLKRQFLVNMRLMAEFTREWRNVFGPDGEMVTEAAEVFILLAGDLAGGSIIASETRKALIEASSLSGDELKNFVGQCAGLSTLEDPAAKTA